ncbi:right-handed parallel beta-helix repeat-containing protein [Aminobacter anthyllidis]|uniref:right-handed parallel beta-helix repeat-containing protein n=1 Tax=Aminobacter anthyllidis TaxID=1035067 RepID=UPI0024579FC9|nr:right-handed parallel beta-helix repeat-containing protein [Aminobacter anthyllidis]MDH4988690.1 right-handed parallel beta-helix repeat-containing protein [Aminobacter anthyllidis]
MAICSVSSAHAEDALAKRWGPWVETGGQLGKGRSLGQLNLFVPLFQNGDTLVFTDLRGKFDNNDSVEGNFGLGIRHMLPSGWNLGAYGYYDVRRSPYGNTFHQLTLGAEALSEVFDLRANAYLPIGETERRMDLGATATVGPWSSQAILTGTSLAIHHQAVQTTTTSYRVEKALAGADAELGIRLPVFEPDSGFDMRAFVGGYYFGGSGVEAIAGPRARLEFSADDFADLPGVKVTAGLTFQHDDVRGDQWITQARLRIPLQAASSAGREPLSYMERRMTDTVVRDVDIVSNTRNGTRSTYDTLTSSEDAVNAWNGKTITSVVRIDGTTQDQAALQAALDSVGAQGIVLLNGNLAATGAISLNDKQLLVGGGTVLKLKGATSGVAVDYAAAGSAGRISGAASDTLVRMAADSSMRGISVENTSSSANSWAVSGASGASLRDVSVISAANGVRVDGTANFTLQGGSITAAKGSAVAIKDSTGVSISGATIVQNGASGIGIGIVADNVAGRIEGNTITTNGNGTGYNDTHASARPAHGLWVNNSGGLTIANNVITTNGELANGIHVTGSAGIAISGNKVTTNNYMSRGIRLIDSDGATISGNTVATNTTNDTSLSLYTAAFGIMTEGSDNLTVSGNSVTTRARGAAGILLRYSANSTISGNTVTTNGENATAVALVGSASNTVSGNTLTTTNPNNSHGVSIGFNSHNGVVENNTVTSAGPHGVYVWSSGVAVRDNRLVGRGNSGVLTTAGDTIVTGNTP